MGYTHYWRQSRAFTAQEWTMISAEAKRICAKAMRAMYSGPETALTAQQTDRKMGFAVDYAEKGAWRTFPHPEIATPAQGDAIALAGSHGEGAPKFGDDCIALNGSESKGEAYESFVLERAPKRQQWDDSTGPLFAFCKTEYRPYDAVVVSILAVAAKVAPDAIKVSSDGGDEVIRLMF